MTCEVKGAEDGHGMVDEVVLARLLVRRCGKVDAVGLAHGLDLVVRARQAEHGRVEVEQVLSHRFGAVPGRVDRDEDREDAPLAELLVCVESKRSEGVRRSEDLDGLMRSTTSDILSSSSGQMSGQFVNPNWMSMSSTSSGRRDDASARRSS